MVFSFLFSPQFLLNFWFWERLAVALKGDTRGERRKRKEPERFEGRGGVPVDCGREKVKTGS